MDRRGRRVMRTGWRGPALAIGAAAALAGCNPFTAIGETSLSDRCADLMHRAFPGADIDVTRQTASAELSAATAVVAGVRRDLPAGSPGRRDLAVECRFENNILTGFRWTAGPLR